MNDIDVIRNSDSKYNDMAESLFPTIYGHT
jgi:hypothetical protein